MTKDTADPANTVAFQGVPGAYSQQACREVFPEMTALPCETFEDAFAAVKEGRADRAMIPIENSLGGRVADIHHLLPESGLYIVGEHFQPVRHQLLAPAEAKLTGIKRIYSHVQGLSQCRALIRELGAEAIPRADTAGAAAEVAERGNPEEAAIASALAGEIYGLQTLRERIEDKLGNTTRFIILSRTRIDPDLTVPSITSIIFRVRSTPAALYKSLGGFATNGVNVLKLESYMTDMSFTVAQFYAELEGHVAAKNMDIALGELQFFSTMLKVIGVYPQSPWRESNH